MSCERAGEQPQGVSPVPKQKRVRGVTVTKHSPDLGRVVQVHTVKVQVARHQHVHPRTGRTPRRSRSSRQLFAANRLHHFVHKQRQLVILIHQHAKPRLLRRLQHASAVIGGVRSPVALENRIIVDNGLRVRVEHNEKRTLRLGAGGSLSCTRTPCFFEHSCENALRRDGVVDHRLREPTEKPTVVLRHASRPLCRVGNTPPIVAPGETCDRQGEAEQREVECAKKTASLHAFVRRRTACSAGLVGTFFFQQSALFPDLIVVTCAFRSTKCPRLEQFRGLRRCSCCALPRRQPQHHESPYHAREYNRKDQSAATAVAHKLEHALWKPEQTKVQL
mmetsp:Transcript_1333/g.3008  ORF Transcript_1333/g.3008 Transcript_1333/m.3008 type:complete len:334 (-) Transcript_1333:1208-2209(-)